MSNASEYKSEYKKITVLGAGKFGRALADIAAHNGHQVTLWARDINKYQDVCNQPMTSHLEQALDNVDLVLIAIPSSSFKAVLQQASPYLNDQCWCVSAAKGLDPNGQKRMSEILADVVDHNRIGVISGPNLALEIIDKRISGTVIASINNELNQQVQQIFASTYLRVYSSHDVAGVEWAGVLKNIYAILYGMVEQLNLGDNTKGLLFARSLIEIARFSLAHDAQINTFLGVAGVGDLLTTCNSPLSRNYQIGQHIAKGVALDDAIKMVGETAEGVNTTAVIYQLSQQKSIDMPLVSELYGVLFNGVSTNDAIQRLMSRMQTEDARLLISTN